MKTFGALLGFVAAVVLVSSGPAFGQPIHVAAVTSDGRLWHTIRQPNGMWQPFGDVGQQTGQQSIFSSVASALDGTTLHVVGAARDGRLWHTLRHPNGVWQRFVEIPGQGGPHSGFSSVTASAASGLLGLVATTRDGRLWHTIRNTTGAWQPFGDVKSQAGDRGSFVSSAAAAVGQQNAPRSGSLPRYQPPSSVPAQRAVGHGCGKCDTVDDVPVHSVSNDTGVRRAAEAALRSLRMLTQADPSWLDSYIAVENASPVSRTLEGKLFLRVDAIEAVTNALQR
jgi:hypothetical protein